MSRRIRIVRPRSSMERKSASRSSSSGRRGTAGARCGVARGSGSSARARRPSRTPETSPWRPASFERCMPPAMSPSSGSRRRKSCDGQDRSDDASSQSAMQGADRGGVLSARQQDCWALAWHGGVLSNWTDTMERGGRWADRHGIRLAAAPAAAARRRKLSDTGRGLCLAPRAKEEFVQFFSLAGFFRRALEPRE